MSKVQIDQLTKIFGRQPSKALELLDKGMSKQEILEKTGCTVGVNQASLTVDESETFVIMGLSGSGKSTLVRLINRLIEPTSGTVRIDDENISTATQDQLRTIRRQKIGMVFQGFALFPHMNVLENTAYGLKVQGMPTKEREQKAFQSLELVGLAGYEQQYPSQLSGGMQQRVGLARALTNDPDILLMDEAFSALDPLIRKDMQDELLELQATMQKTIIFITHDLDEALRIGDRIALMKDGSIVQIGTPEQILMNPANSYVERFVQDVDLSKVLTAESVMKRAEYITSGKDGIRVALRRMREQGISSIYVVNRQNKLIGVMTAEAAAQAVQNKNEDLESIMQTAVPTTSPDTPILDLFEETAGTDIPVAVVDENKRLRGVLVRGAILAGLAKNGGNTDG